MDTKEDDEVDEEVGGNCDGRAGKEKVRQKEWQGGHGEASGETKARKRRGGRNKVAHAGGAGSGKGATAGSGKGATEKTDPNNNLQRGILPNVNKIFN